MAQPPAYNREKNFTLNSGRETDHAALNAELDKASNSINDIRTNLAILQADDGKLRPSVVTPDSISEELRVSLVEGVVMDAQAMLDESRKASETSKSSAEKAKESETKAAASEKAATASWEQAQAIAGEVQKRADDIVQTASDQAKEYARSAQTSAQEARCVYGKIEKRADDIVEEAAREAEKQAQASAGSAASADRSAEEAALHAAIAGQRGIPVGTVVMFTAAEPPAGYLKCDGAAVGRETCPELFAAIGTTYGEGDGSTTFNLPDSGYKKIDFDTGTTELTAPDNGYIFVKASASLGGFYLRNLTKGYLSESLAERDWGLGAFIPCFKGDQIEISSWQSTINSVFFATSPSAPFCESSNGCLCIKAFDAAVDSGLIDITELANEMAGKADTNLSNLSATGKAKAAHLAMPSGNYVGLSIPVTNTDVTAPADGYFYSVIFATAASNGYMNFINRSTGFGVMSNVPASSAEKHFMPVRKGDVVRVEYNNLSEETTFGFFYAEGSQP